MTEIEKDPIEIEKVIETDQESDRDRDQENPTLSRHHGGPKCMQVNGYLQKVLYGKGHRIESIEIKKVIETEMLCSPNVKRITETLRSQ